MPDIVLTTINARYAHSAFGLRYLMANLGPLQSRARILEFDISQQPKNMVEAIVAQNPQIVGLGVYIWNVDTATKLVGILKRVRPQITVILGGPEVSFETDQQEIIQLADFVITGEADVTFGKVCETILSGSRPPEKIIPAQPPEFDALELPYDLYDDEDIAHRVIYVESSRGCPFGCEFCLSSLDASVRYAPPDRFLTAMQSLMDRGVHRFKFVDRTFNLQVKRVSAILQFLLERDRPGMFLHFEIIPDILPAELRDLIKKFSPGALQFEVGIQTFNPEVAKLIARQQDNTKVEDNLCFLRQQTGAHIHADLIVGLPGETIESFAAGFDRLVCLKPQEIQVGMLKRLRGAPIARHDDSSGMIYNPHPPYEILANGQIDFPTMQQLGRFARYWDLVANSGNFIDTTPMIWGTGSPFAGFMDLCDWLFSNTGRTQAIALTRLAELVFRYLTDKAGAASDQAAEVVWRDYQRGGRSDLPRFLRGYDLKMSGDRPRKSRDLARQGRFAAPTRAPEKHSRKPRR